ncbi:MAG TPA: tRNA glutamyl-Q(34) synthetase GluQRS, partial [Holophagaceae bacterium]|nr:tRNA glutamyl-Q(34) synthetase GluQRS [Holophagaceae bacterium]
MAGAGLTGRVAPPIIGRFAPSPTGPLHLGNLRTALASWLSAKAAGGRWLLRVEDVDGPRCRTAFAEAQLRDLEALGLVPEGPVLRQSERGEAYRAALQRLHEQDRLYPCVCTRKDLQRLASAPHAEDGLRPYDGACRARPWEGFDAALRFRLPEGEVAWEDRLLGPQRDDPERLTGDPLLFRRDGVFAYHLAVVVDDGAEGVTEVVRGADLRSVTATQVRLQEALGLPRPAYAHLGLVAAPDGSRLGKRAGALDLAALAARGASREMVTGWLGFSLGCLDRPEPCRAEDLIPRFAWGRIPPGE